MLRRRNEPVDISHLEQMMAASAGRAVNGQDVWHGGHVALGHQHFWITPEEQGERQPLSDAAGRWAIAFDGRLDNRREVVNQLALDSVDPGRLSDAALVMRAYARWGTSCIKHFLGAFAFAIWDVEQEHLFLARDALGARELCYFDDGALFLAGSEVAQLLAHPEAPRELNEGRIADFLAGHWHNQEETYYQHILYCPPAHCLLVSEAGLKKWRYWKLDAGQRIRYRRDEEYAEHFLDILTEAVRCRLRTIGPVGVSMSGGLDSTTLAAIAAGLMPEVSSTQERLHSFSYVFDELTALDERRYIRPMVERYQLDATYIPCDDEWTFRDLPNWPFNRGFLLSDPYARLPEAVMRAAQEKGCRLLLTGYFGDVLFTGQQFWAATMLREWRWLELLRTSFENRSNIGLRRDLVDNGIRQLVPTSLRSAYRRARPMKIQSSHPGIHPSLATLAEAREKPGEIDGVDGPLTTERKHQYHSLTLNVFSQGASAVRIRYNSHGMDLSTPYRDQRLIGFIMAIPADKLGRPRRDRELLRKATAGLLPHDVCTRQHFTVFLPLMKKGLLSNGREAVAEMFSDPIIFAKQYVNAEWLQARISRDDFWSDGNDRYFIWRCLSLEFWLKSLSLRMETV